MKSFRRYLTILLSGYVIASVSATTVIPPTFNQLVGEAELIFEGTVTDAQSQWFGQGRERVIVTYVTFQIADAIKGTPGRSYTIRMLGGTIDGETAEVADAPRFQIGDHDVLFVEHNNQQFVPLVGIMHGRFRVQRNLSGEEIVAKDNSAGLAQLEKLGTDEAAAVFGRPLSLVQFKSAIRQKMHDQGLSR
jgi:hypothetical protein